MVRLHINESASHLTSQQTVENPYMLKANYKYLLEAGTDEAGRGCLAGPVTAAAVILPKDFVHETLNDSKILTALKRDYLRPLIETNATDLCSCASFS